MYDNRQADRDFGCLLFAIWALVAVVNIAFLGVIVWAIIALVTHFT